MALKQRNVGSIRHLTQGLPSKKRRISDNHNRRGIQNNPTVTPVPIDPGVAQDLSVMHDLTNDADGIPPKLEHKKKKKGDSQKPFRLVLNRLQDKLELFERIQLDKKKIETAEITATKIKAMSEAMEKQFLTKPQLIGAIPSVTNQEEIAFDCWMMHHHESIFKTKSIKADVDLFITQLVSLKAADAEWRQFLNRWKLLRILHKDDFTAIWKSVRKELNIPTDDPVIELAEFSDEEPNDEDVVSALNDKDEL